MIAIGVTGHRKLRNLDLLTSTVDEVFETIQERYSEGISRVISPLAEGADRLVAKRAIDKCDVELVVPLPFEKAEYELDFESNESKLEFENLINLAVEVIELPEKDSRELSYLSAGMFVLEKCDVLVAIWDGAPPKGIGGTGQIVGQARNQGKPIAWIHVEDQNRATSQGTSPPRIHYERFPIDDKHQGGNL